MHTGIWRGIVAAAAIVAGSTGSSASTVGFKFLGTGVSSALTLTIEPASQQGTLPSIPANAVNPSGSFAIRDAHGTFTDIDAGITNETVVGVEALNHAAPDRSNALAPYDFSLLRVASGVLESNGKISPGLHFDDLFYPGGSPQTASEYAPHGGSFDIYGLVFLLANGDAVNLWSSGVGQAGAIYGLAVTDRVTLLDYRFNGIAAVPLPGAAPLLGTALLAVGAAGYGLRRRRAAVPA